VSGPASTWTEAELVDRARAGRPEAIEALLEAHEPRLFRFAHRLCRHHEDAEDVLQESMLAAARGIRGFRGSSSVSTWLYTIVRSFCIKKRRRRVLTPTLVSLEGEAALAARAVADAGPAPDESLARARTLAALEKAIASLDRPYREVLLLRDVEGLSAAEVAAITGLRVPAVKTRLHRARARVRRELAPVLGRKGPASGAGAAPCPDVARLLSRYVEGDIQPATCARMEHHLASCPRCQATCDSLKELLRSCRSLEAPQVPAGLQEKLREAIRAVVAAA
jgi:RNA polymerase sigma-70 factor (ECF subfamily)